MLRATVLAVLAAATVASPADRQLFTRASPPSSAAQDVACDTCVAVMSVALTQNKTTLAEIAKLLNEGCGDLFPTDNSSKLACDVIADGALVREESDALVRGESDAPHFRYSPCPLPHDARSQVSRTSCPSSTRASRRWRGTSRWASAPCSSPYASSPAARTPSSRSKCTSPSRAPTCQRCGWRG